jgi:hypothetical protein
MEIPLLMVTDALDVSQEGVIYMGNRAMRLRFDTGTGSIVIEKYVAGVWVTRLTI